VNCPYSPRYGSKISIAKNERRLPQKIMSHCESGFSKVNALF
jgi:hypothetical protein